MKSSCFHIWLECSSAYLKYTKELEQNVYCWCKNFIVGNLRTVKWIIGGKSQLVCLDWKPGHKLRAWLKCASMDKIYCTNNDEISSKIYQLFAKCMQLILMSIV